VFPLGERCVNFGIPLAAGRLQQLHPDRPVARLCDDHERDAHDARIIPLDGRPHLDKHLRTWERRSARALGGRHAGDRDDELLAEDDFMARTRTCGSPSGSRAPVPDILNYEFTVDDPRRGRRRGPAMIPLKLKDE
jgi:hypothetical protein